MGTLYGELSTNSHSYIVAIMFL